MQGRETSEVCWLGEIPAIDWHKRKLPARKKFEPHSAESAALLEKLQKLNELIHYLYISDIN